MSNTTPVKKSFFSGVAKTVKTDAEAVLTEVESEVIYSADTAVANIQAEAKRLDELVASKTTAIAAHNKEILKLQTSVTSLEADVAKAQALKAKITTAIS